MAPLLVCLIGPESTGKTEIAALLRARFGFPVVDEYAREYAEQHPGELTFEDVDPIGRGELASLEAGTKDAAGVVILDTDLLSTVAYSRHYYGRCPRWIEEEAARRLADRYFLLGVDVPWVDDDVRDAAQDRAAVFATFRSVLVEFGARFDVVTGGWDERCAAVITAVGDLAG